MNLPHASDDVWQLRKGGHCASRHAFGMGFSMKMIWGRLRLGAWLLFTCHVWLP